MRPQASSVSRVNSRRPSAPSSGVRMMGRLHRNAATRRVVVRSLVHRAAGRSMNLPSKRILILTSMLAAARVALLATAATRSPSIAADSCESLRSLKLPGTTIVLSERVAAGAFRLPDAYIGGPWAPGPRGGQPVVALQESDSSCGSRWRTGTGSSWARATAASPATPITRT